MSVEDGPGGSATRLTTADYERLLDAAPTYRQRLVVRLAGEAGLTASEVTRVRPSDREGLDGYRGDLLRVRGSDGDRRPAYLPPSLGKEFSRYVNSNSVPRVGRVVDVSVRRVQMLVSEVGDAAAAETGDDGFAEVSAGDLRDYYARNRVGEGVDPVVVKEAGGWKSLGSLDRYVEEPDAEEVAAAFERRQERETSSGGTFDAATEALVTASNRDETVRVVCDALASSYDFAWVEGVRLEGDEPSVDARAGEKPAGFDAAKERIPDGLDEPFYDDQAAPVVAVPLIYSGTAHGVLGVSDTDGFDGPERDRIELLGEQVAHALTAERRRKALFADSVVEIELRTTDTDDFLVPLTDRLGCSFELRSVVSASDSVDLLHVTLRGAEAPTVFEAVEDIDAVEDTRLVEQRGTDAFVEFSVRGGTVISALQGYGATVTEAVYEDGEGTVVADCARDAELQTVVDGVRSRFPETTLVGKRDADRSVRTTESFTEDVTRRLTDRQEEALRAAYFGGYFDWPRGSTAEEVADSMDVSSPTLHNHLRKGQREILRTLFDD